MKLYFFSTILVTILFATGCQESKIENLTVQQNPGVLLNHYGDTIHLYSPLDSVLLEFVEQNHLKNIHGLLYVDKIYQDTTIITIVSRQFVIPEKELADHTYAYPLFYVKIKDCIFDVYSGLEDEFTSNYRHPKRERDTSKYIVWRINKVEGRLTRYKMDDVPFVPGIVP